MIEVKFHDYCTTSLEDWVTKFYSRIGIIKPKQIDITAISRCLRIYVHYKPIYSYFEVIGRYQGIVIDCREPPEKHREIFFHELCHILRHAGVQSMMPKAFRELQEWDARHFVKYAAIPFHMLQYINFDDSHVVEQMTDIFKVSPELCLERLLQLQRNGYFRQSVPTQSFHWD
ncbi:ImmA/IrrE family metallo-endopeptidase [Heyndrickxia faecalis]|uniref:ImmA/IrrE family metallo-endopeptidase n=1 Tax=Heyndrickxia faecalis TaxID=2824910 RepID=A0AAU7WBW6_9BACI